MVVKEAVLLAPPCGGGKTWHLIAGLQQAAVPLRVYAERLKSGGKEEGRKREGRGKEEGKKREGRGKEEGKKRERRLEGLGVEGKESGEKEEWREVIVADARRIGERNW